FIQEAARRGVDLDRVNFVLGNEPNLAYENRDRYLPPADYVAAVRSVREELVARGVDANLAGPGLSPGLGAEPMKEYFKGLMDAGLGKYVDVYAMHEYQDSLVNIRDLNDITRQYGQEKPIVISEFGIPRINGLDADGQAAAYRSFLNRVMEWNADPSRPPIESVTVWIHNRGPGQEAYLPTSQMIETLGQMSQSKYTPTGNLDLGGLPPAGGGGPGTGAVGGGPEGSGGTGPGGDSWARGGGGKAAQAGALGGPAGLRSAALSEEQVMMLALAAMQEIAGGVPGQACQTLARMAPQLAFQPLSGQTRSLVDSVLSMLGLPPLSAAGAPQVQSPLSAPGSGKAGGSGGGGGGANGSQFSPPPEAAAPPVDELPEIPAGDPDAEFNVSSIRPQMHPGSPSAGPGYTFKFADEQGRPIAPPEGHRFAIQYGGGVTVIGENKPEDGAWRSSSVFVPTYSNHGRMNFTPGTVGPDGKFKPVGPGVGLDVTREHRVGEVVFRKNPEKKPEAPADKPKPESKPASEKKK
ncbi:MAG: hypothetical protein AB1758_37130, partial [Candidatus Eremiobacterota bacterium]